MAVTINGSGTVTGISVGGLPDGIVDTDMLAANAVVTGKITDGTIVSGDIANGTIVSGDIADGTIVSGDISGGLPAAGVTEVDMWRLHTTFEGGANPITSNWERSDSNGEGKLGTGMTESSGVFSFPSTGYWHVMFHSNFYSGADYRSCVIYLKVSIDGGSNYSYNSDGYGDLYAVSSNGYQSAEASDILDVTNTSTFKVTFGVSAEANKYTVGGSSQNQTYAIFTKLAET